MSKICGSKKQGEYDMLHCVRPAGHEGYCDYCVYEQKKTIHKKPWPKHVAKETMLKSMREQSAKEQGRSVLQKIQSESNWLAGCRIHKFPGHTTHFPLSVETHRLINEYNNTGEQLRRAIKDDAKKASDLVRSENKKTD